MVYPVFVMFYQAFYRIDACNLRVYNSGVPRSLRSVGPWLLEVNLLKQNCLMKHIFHDLSLNQS